jgi:hypothetical protein
VKAQHGFIIVSKKSCTTNLLELETQEILTKSLSDGLPVDLVYLEF